MGEGGKCYVAMVIQYNMEIFGSLNNTYLKNVY